MDSNSAIGPDLLMSTPWYKCSSNKPQSKNKGTSPLSTHRLPSSVYCPLPFGIPITGLFALEGEGEGGRQITLHLLCLEHRTVCYYKSYYYLGQHPKDSFNCLRRPTAVHPKEPDINFFFYTDFLWLLTVRKFTSIFIQFCLQRYLPFCPADTFSRIH